MAAKNVKHTVEGAVGERKSPRTYTHAVVGRRNWDAELKGEMLDAEARATDSYNYHQRVAKATVGQKWHEVHGGRISDLAIDADHIKEAQQWIAANPVTLGECIAAQVRKQVARVNERRANMADFLQVLQWSMSEANAHKAIGTWQKRRWLDVQVLPVTRHDK